MQAVDALDSAAVHEELARERGDKNVGSLIAFTSEPCVLCSTAARSTRYFADILEEAKASKLMFMRLHVKRVLVTRLHMLIVSEITTGYVRDPPVFRYLNSSHHKVSGNGCCV